MNFQTCALVFLILNCNIAASDVPNISDDNELLNENATIIFPDLAAPARPILTRRPINTTDNHYTSEGIVPKRPRTQTKSSTKFSSMDPSLSHDQIIENELKFGYALNASQADALSKALKCISNDDSTGFSSLIPILKRQLTNSPHSYSRNGIPDYFKFVAILFGAKNMRLNRFFDRLHKTEAHDDILLDAIKYLFSTKSFDTAVDTVAHYCAFSFDAATKTKLLRFVHEMYPNLDYYQRLMIELIDSPKNYIYAASFMPKSDREKMIYLAKVAHDLYDQPKANKLVSRLPLEKPALYQGLSDLMKMNLFRSVINLDDEKLFVEVLLLEPKIIYCPDFINLLVTLKSETCLRVLFEIAPEIIGCKMDVNISPFGYFFEHNMYSRTKEIVTKFLDLFEEYGMNHNYIVLVNNTEYTLLELAFSKVNEEILNYYINKLDADEFKRLISKKWPTENELVCHIFNNFYSVRLIKWILKTFEIDIYKETFEFNGKTGNATIFFGPFSQSGSIYRGIINKIF